MTINLLGTNHLLKIINLIFSIYLYTLILLVAINKLKNYLMMRRYFLNTSPLQCFCVQVKAIKGTSFR